RAERRALPFNVNARSDFFRAFPDKRFNLIQMADAYHQLLDAAIQHLEGLKQNGVRFVVVSPENMAALGQPASAPSPRISPPAATAAPRPVAPRPAPIAVAPVLTVMSSADPAKTAAFAELRSRVMPCVKCAHLAASRKTVVFGVGNIDSPLMFVG